MTSLMLVNRRTIASTRLSECMTTRMQQESEERKRERDNERDGIIGEKLEKTIAFI